MVNYICDKCGKTFSQKSHYDKHINKKYMCVKKKLRLHRIGSLMNIERS